MKAINFYLQVIVFGLVILLILGNFLFPGIIIYVLYIQFLLGCYQYLAGSYFIIFRKLFAQFKYYWLMATLDLLVLIGGITTNTTGIAVLNAVFFFIIPWGLALYFLWLSIILYKKS